MVVGTKVSVSAFARTARASLLMIFTPDMLEGELEVCPQAE
jgi:hypothetical protein